MRHVEASEWRAVLRSFLGQLRLDAWLGHAFVTLPQLKRESEQHDRGFAPRYAHR